MGTAARAHIWRHAPATTRPRHFHPEPEFNWVAAGRARFGMGEKVLDVREGDILWWPPGQDHVLIDASPDFDLFVVGITPELSARALPHAVGSAGGWQVRARLPASESARWLALCAAPLSATDVPAVEARVGDLWREAQSYRVSEASLHASTRRALLSVHDRPELARDELADILGAYPTELSRHFRKDLGLKLTAYRTRVRLMRFIHAVDQGADNWMSAALAAGFGSYSQFHRTFHLTLGCAPRDFFGTNARIRMQDRFSPMEPNLR
jgi:AraC-like DNA-binding protein/mannose-6-phosphate isomerase-like protein (cupin superfamily)